MNTVLGWFIYAAIALPLAASGYIWATAYLDCQAGSAVRGTAPGAVLYECADVIAIARVGR